VNQVKKIFLLIVLIVVVFLGYAQKQKVNYLTTFDDKLIHFGFTLGLNTLDFAVVNTPLVINGDINHPNWPVDGGTEPALYSINADVNSMIPGFTVGIISSLRLARDFNLRFQPGLSFGDRHLTYNVPVRDETIYEPQDFYSIKSTFLDFPVLVKYKARRINNDRPYVVFGGAYRQDISKTAKEDLVKLKNGGLYAEVGAGWDHYFTFFRFSVEAKFSFGLNNQLGDAPLNNPRKYYSQSISSLRSNIFTLSFHFE
jgi:hypothetical protein